MCLLSEICGVKAVAQCSDDAAMHSCYTPVNSAAGQTLRLNDAGHVYASLSPPPVHSRSSVFCSISIHKHQHPQQAQHTSEKGVQCRFKPTMHGRHDTRAKETKETHQRNTDTKEKECAVPLHAHHARPPSPTHAPTTRVCGCNT